MKKQKGSSLGLNPNLGENYIQLNRKNICQTLVWVLKHQTKHIFSGQLGSTLVSTSAPPKQLRS